MSSYSLIVAATLLFGGIDLADPPAQVASGDDVQLTISGVTTDQLGTGRLVYWPQDGAMCRTMIDGISGEVFLWFRTKKPGKYLVWVGVPGGTGINADQAIINVVGETPEPNPPNPGPEPGPDPDPQPQPSVTLSEWVTQSYQNAVPAGRLRAGKTEAAHAWARGIRLLLEAVQAGSVQTLADFRSANKAFAWAQLHRDDALALDELFDDPYLTPHLIELKAQGYLDTLPEYAKIWSEVATGLEAVK